MKLLWPHLGDPAPPETAQNAGYSGYSGYTPEKSGGCAVTGASVRPVTVVTESPRQTDVVTAHVRAVTTPVTENRNKNKPVTAITSVTTKTGVIGTERRLEPVRSAPGTCVYCGRQGQAGSDLMPYFTGLDARAACHVWLHPGCATAWHAIWRAGGSRH